MKLDDDLDLLLERQFGELTPASTEAAVHALDLHIFMCYLDRDMRERAEAKRNLTLSLPYSVVRKAKEMAVREDRTLNAYVRTAIEEKIERTAGYAAARKRQQKRLAKGLALGTRGGKPSGRDELHERT